MRHFCTIITFILFSVFLFSCGEDNDSDPEPWYTIERSNTFSGTAPEVFLVETPGNVELTYTLDLGDIPRDVYFIFTNTTMTDASSNPVVQNSLSTSDPLLSAISKSETLNDYVSLSDTIDDQETPLALRGTPEITEFSRDPFAHIQNDGYDRVSKSIYPPTPFFDSEESSGTFYDDTGNIIYATCRKIINKDVGNSVPVTLNVWVADNSWNSPSDGCDRKKCVTQDMVDILAAKFLSATADNDIYDWITTIFGIEWGAHTYSNLIGDTDEITILLYDILDDNSISGGVLGFFYPRDNFFKSSSDDILKYSNQRIMFYLDSVLYATNDSLKTWDISHYWPSEIISTLAHEFQHMIHFYQKTVLRASGSGTETWLNELLSLVSEDLVASKIFVNGPRGVAYNEPTAGTGNNINGRLPLYNYFNYESLVNWYASPGDPRVFRNYAINYAFGAYLARSYGGAPFMRNLLWNQYTDYRAIDYALQNTGHPAETFATVMRKWAAANLLSDIISPIDSTYYYNIDDWFKSEINTIDYSLGSINLYNYRYSGLTGPRIFTTSPVGTGTQQPKATNYYFLVGTGLTGEITQTITMEKEIKLTVVVK